MQHSTAPLWPHTAANNGRATPEADPWGMGAVIENQTRLWNQLLDANRSFWALCTPWLQLGTVWPWSAVDASTPGEEEGMEPATTADGIPDPLELQARSWNRFLDASRSFWGTMAWPMPMAPWMASPGEGAAAKHEEERGEDRPSKVTPLPRSTSRKPKPPKSRAA